MIGRFIRDLTIYLPSKVLPALTAFITAPIVTRLLAPADFGNYALAVGVYDFLFALACSGLGAGAVRFYSAYKARGQLRPFFFVLGVSLLSAIAGGCAAALLVLAWLGNRLPGDLRPLLRISVLVFVVQAAYLVLLQVVRAQERSKLYTTFELLTNYGSLALGLLLLGVWGWGASGMLWGTFIAFGAATAILPLLVLRDRSGANWRWRPGDMGSLWRYAWPLALGNMAMWGLRLSDRYMLGVFRPRAEVGLYSAAYNISSKSIDLLVAVFLLSMGPLIINTWEQYGPSLAQETLKSTTRVFLIVCMPAAAGLSALAAPFVALLTAGPYHEGYRIVALVVFSSLAYGLSQIVSTGLLIAKRTRRIAINQVLAALLNLGLNFLLVPRYGFVAAGATTLIGYLTLFALQAHASRRSLSWPFPFRTLRNVVIASVASSSTAAGLYALSGGGDHVYLGYLMLGIIAAIFVYGICLVLLREFDSREMAAIQHTLRQVGSVHAS